MTPSPSGRRSMAHGAAALPKHGREHNLSLVLQTLHSQGVMSRADLARTLGLTRVTVSDLVSELLERNHVLELGLTEAGRPGKPAILLDVNRQGMQIIGLDLADSSVMRAAVMDLDGTMLTRLEYTTADERGEEAALQVLELTRRAVAAATAPIIGIGVGTPGIVDDAGLILTAPNFSWHNLDLRTLLESETGLTTLVANDADCAVMGEHTFGGGSAHMMLVKIGRGVGCGTIVNGTRVRGVNSAGGEIGHVVVGTDPGPACSCGKHGCIEAWCAVPALRRALADAADGDAHSPAGRRILTEAGRRLGIAVAPIVSVLDLREVVLAGPGAYVTDELAAVVAQTIAERTMASERPEFSVRLSHSPDDVVLLGAAVTVLWNQLGIA